MKGLRVLFLVFMGVFLSGCGYFQSDDQPANPQDEMCTYLKRQMTYNANSNSIDARFATPSQKKELIDRYQEYGCK